MYCFIAAQIRNIVFLKVMIFFNTGTISDVIYDGSSRDVPDELLTFTVVHFDLCGKDSIDVVIEN